MREKKNCKRFFVSTTESGKWETLSLKPPFDWKSSLTSAECQTIAYESRRIAAAENRPVSVMWFIGVPPSVATSPAIPWYHEQVDVTLGRRTSTALRKKTAFDRYYLIKCAKDLEELR